MRSSVRILSSMRAALCHSSCSIFSSSPERVFAVREPRASARGHAGDIAVRRDALNRGIRANRPSADARGDASRMDGG